jgi:hypothetical protein
LTAKIARKWCGRPPFQMLRGSRLDRGPAQYRSAFRPFAGGGSHGPRRLRKTLATVIELYVCEETGACFVDERTATAEHWGAYGAGVLMRTKSKYAAGWRGNYRYVKDRSMYPLQDAARADRLGLWADAAPIAPREWRQAQGADGVSSEKMTPPSYGRGRRSTKP